MPTRAERRRAEKRKNQKIKLPCNWPHCVSFFDMLHCQYEEVHWKDCPRQVGDEIQNEAKEHILTLNAAPTKDAEQCAETGEHPAMKERWEKWEVGPSECPGCGETPVFESEEEDAV